MGTEVNGNNVLLGRGKLYFNRDDASGNPTGERFLGNVSTLETTPTPEQIKKYSSATKAADLIAADVIRAALEIRITGDEYSKENVALAFFANVGTLSQTGSTATAEEHDGCLQDRFYKLLYRDVSSVVVKGTGGTPTYVITDDYTVDAVSGRIYIVPGGGIADDTDLEVDYTYGTIALDTVLGMTQTSVKGSLRFIGDPARGPAVEFIVWRLSVRSDVALGFISDEYGSFSLIGDVESDATNHPTEPHFRLIYL